MNNNIKTKGTVERIIKYSDGRTETTTIENTVLLTGQMALAASLAGLFGDHYDYFIRYMVFGSGGMADGQTTRFVPVVQNKLFAPIGGATKGISAVIDPNIRTQVVFSVMLDFGDVNTDISEMALVMNNGDLYSMTTFPTLTKNQNMQITWNWRLSFI